MVAGAVWSSLPLGIHDARRRARRSRTQPLINTIYADYLPNNVVVDCAADYEEDAGLIPLLTDRPTRDGRASLRL